VTVNEFDRNGWVRCVAAFSIVTQYHKIGSGDPVKDKYVASGCDGGILYNKELDLCAESGERALSRMPHIVPTDAIDVFENTVPPWDGYDKCSDSFTETIDFGNGNITVNTGSSDISGNCNRISAVQTATQTHDDPSGQIHSTAEQHYSGTGYTVVLEHEAGCDGGCAEKKPRTIGRGGGMWRGFWNLVLKVISSSRNTNRHAEVVIGASEFLSV